MVIWSAPPKADFRAIHDLIDTVIQQQTGS